MSLLDWAGVYLVVGAGSAFALGRRAPRPAARDLGLVVVLWPIYVPLLFAVAAPPRAGVDDEHARLGDAIAAIDDPTIARLLPTRAQLDALGARFAALEARVVALDRALDRERPPAPEDISEHAEGARVALRRLAELRDRAHRERDELAALVRKLRVQITVIGFSGASPEDALDLAAELAARVDGVGAALASTELEARR